MKKIILTLLISSFTGLSFAQEADRQDVDKKEATKQEVVKKDNGEFNFTGSIHNQWYWRGYAVGPDVIIAAQASYTYKGLEVGTWNGYGLAGIFKDTDLYVSYTFKKNLKIALWDIYNYSDYSASPSYAQYGNHTQDNYFNYGDNTRHFFDLSIGYTIPKTNLNLFVATIIAGRDKNADKSNRFSSYVKASYDFNVKNNITVSPYISCGFALNSDNGGTFWQWTDRAVADAHNFGINEVGFNVSKPIKITETYTIKASGGAVASPLNGTMTGLLGVTLF